MARSHAVYLCGMDDRPGPRGTDCPSAVHDHPLPAGFLEASGMAEERLLAGWGNPACPDCGLHGWTRPPAAEGEQEASGPCIGNDPTCPCQDGDPCHYRTYGNSPGWPIPRGGEQG